MCEIVIGALAVRFANAWRFSSGTVESLNSLNFQCTGKQSVITEKLFNQMLLYNTLSKLPKGTHGLMYTDYNNEGQCRQMRYTK
jgi:ubiquinone biosynthesis protein Coq4